MTSDHDKSVNSLPEEGWTERALEMKGGLVFGVPGLNLSLLKGESRKNVRFQIEP